jgi:hypothetical protein
MGAAVDLLRQGDGTLELAIYVDSPVAAGHGTTHRRGRRTNSPVVSSIYSGDGDDSL